MIIVCVRVCACVVCVTDCVLIFLMPRSPDAQTTDYGCYKGGEDLGVAAVHNAGGGEALYIKITKDLHSVQQQQTSEEGHAE